MNIVFRVDSSLVMGSGHLMRCLTLAESFLSKGASVVFISRSHEGNLNTLIREKSFQLFELPIKASGKGAESYAKWLGATWDEDVEQVKLILAEVKPNVLFVDHYSLDYKWENEVKNQCSTLVVIDDLADRKHECDVLIDQTYGRPVEDYQQYVPKQCLCLVGSDYAILRREFLEHREFSLERRKNFYLQNILIMFGGVDNDNFTGRVLQSLKHCNLSKKIQITVVMGANAPHIHKVKMTAKQLLFNVEVLSDVRNMASLMANSDLAIGAAGSSSWERCCLGVPSIAVVVAENQKKIAKNLKDENAVILVNEPVEENLIEELDNITTCKMRELSYNCVTLVDGLGAKRVSERVLGK